MRDNSSTKGKRVKPKIKETLSREWNEVVKERIFLDKPIIK